MQLYKNIKDPTTNTIAGATVRQLVTAVLEHVELADPPQRLQACREFSPFYKTCPKFLVAAHKTRQLKELVLLPRSVAS